MLIQGDCLEELKIFPDNHFTTVCTDPPYGISVLNSNWDDTLPNPEIWKEVNRVCRAGAYMTICGSQKTIHRIACHVEDAGFRVEDIICWIHNRGKGSGHNLKCGLPEWENYGSTLSRVWDPILLAQKRYSGTKKSLAKTYGCGSLNLERFGSEKAKSQRRCHSGDKKYNYSFKIGRLPQNIVLSVEAEILINELIRKGAHNLYYTSPYLKEASLGISTDERTLYDVMDRSNTKKSRNFHPTVKPLGLMTHLVNLTIPPSGGRVLDPFCGSGTTLVACKRLGVDFVGIDLSDEYLDLAEQRLDYENNLFNLHEKTIRIRTKSG